MSSSVFTTYASLAEGKGIYFLRGFKKCSVFVYRLVGKKLLSRTCLLFHVHLNVFTCLVCLCTHLYFYYMLSVLAIGELKYMLRETKRVFRSTSLTV
jgi:hypothetical protein